MKKQDRRPAVETREPALRDLSLAPKHVREFAHFRATFPLRLWIAATVAGCGLALAFPNFVEEDVTASAPEATPMVSATMGPAEPADARAD